LFALQSSKVGCNHFIPPTIQAQEGWVAIRPHLAWQPEPTHMPAQRKIEDTPVGGTARGLASWTESQDWQDRFWWPLHQKSTFKRLAYGDCVWTGECKGTSSEDLPQYVLAALEVTREQTMKDLDRGWLRDWEDTLALAWIILCLLELATRAGVAFGKGLRVASHAVQHHLENRRRHRCSAWAWEQRPVEPYAREEEREAVL
ncbi:MAG: hypothetical protein GY696_29220, partial [Gammaproteobacteria bacterium]|nr:hypothetical protein [Gammaproteobacteria bacterium]